MTKIAVKFPLLGLKQGDSNIYLNRILALYQRALTNSITDYMLIIPIKVTVKLLIADYANEKND